MYFDMNNLLHQHGSKTIKMNKIKDDIDDAKTFFCKTKNIDAFVKKIGSLIFSYLKFFSRNLSSVTLALDGPGSR